MGKSKKIVDVFFRQVIVSFIVATLIIGYLVVSHSINRYSKNTKHIKNEYLEAKKESVRLATIQTVNYIRSILRSSELELKTELQERVYQAHAIANHIYTINKGKKSIKEIQYLIKEALRPMRFNDGRGYYFIGDLKGYDILYPVSPEIEGSYLLDLQDDMGNYVMRDELAVINKSGEGFVKDYWKRPESGDDMAHEKISFVKLFEPLGWYIGAGEYLEDYTKGLEKHILEVVSNMRYDKQGYIFINKYDGKALIKDGQLVEMDLNLWDFEDPNGVKVIQEERRMVKNPEGGYIYYFWRQLDSDEVSPKVSYVMGIPELQWMIGSGVYVDDIDPIVAKRNEQLKSSIKKDVIIIISILLLEIILISILFTFLTKRANNSLQRVSTSFEMAAEELSEIDEKQFVYKEFRTMVGAANKMMRHLRKMESKKKNDDAFFEKLFETAPQAIALYDKNSQLININSKFTELFGYHRQELLVKHLDQILVPPELYKDAVLQTQKLERGIEISFESERLNKDNVRISVLIQGTNVYEGNKKIGMYIMFQDISEQKSTEKDLLEAKNKAEEADRLKTAFLGNMSHEIRTPMNAIMGFSSLLGTDRLSEGDRKTYINLIRESSNSLLRLIDDILDISVIEAKNFRVNLTTFDINKVLDDLLITYQGIIDAKEQTGLQLNLAKPADKETFIIKSDPGRLQQVLSNLVDNAVKFTTDGEINFGYQEKGNILRFYVSDTGIGISQKQIEIIFDRFRQADGSPTRKYSGTGLGLAISKRIVGLLEGRIWVESEEGKGSVFYVEIPNENIPKPSKVSKILSDYAKFDWSNKHILIAEDVPTNYKFLESALKVSKANIMWAKNGEEVIKIIDKEKVDLILMDIQMPKMNGHEALKIIQDRGEGIPVIAQTAYALEKDLKEIVSLGYDDYLVKPVEIKSLFSKVSKVLS